MDRYSVRIYAGQHPDGEYVTYDDHVTEVETLRAEIARLRDILERAKILIEEHNWVWHEDAREAMK